MKARTTSAEVIGSGTMSRGEVAPDARLDVPAPLKSGSPIGQHLRVRRLARMLPGRALYIVDNVGPKWSRRKCWSCGNKFSPGHARSCSFCGTPLRDLRFLMSARWQSSLFDGIEDWVKQRKWRLGIISPVALIYKNNVLYSVYHYNGESLLADEPAPLPGEVVLRMAVKLAEGLIFLHDNGVVLRGFGPENIMVMPDGSVRWFDLDVDRRVIGGARGMYRDRANPIPRDCAMLGGLLLKYCDRADEHVASFCRSLIQGATPTPLEVINAAEQVLSSLQDWGYEPDAHAMSDVGLVRTNNEDAYSWQQVSPKVSLFVVADGMGGHAAGEVASAIATKSVSDRLMAGLASGKSDDKSLLTTMKNAMLTANDAVNAEARSLRKQMGTTLLAAVLVEGKKLCIGHAGDCRAYLSRAGKLEQLTTDHTLVQDLIEDGQITPEEAEVHPRRNVVTVTVGAEKGDLESDEKIVALKPGDRILLCTDGMWGSIDKAVLQGILEENDDRRLAMQELFRAAFDGGTTDNVTAVLFDV